jgi:hypothetical protein
MHEQTHDALHARIAELEAELDLASRNIAALTSIIETPVDLSALRPAQVTAIACNVCGRDISGDQARLLRADDSNRLRRLHAADSGDEGDAAELWAGRLIITFIGNAGA